MHDRPTSRNAHGAGARGPAPRWWPLVVIGAAVTVALVAVWGVLGGQRQDRVIGTYVAGGLGLLLALVWLVGLSRLRWRVRLAALGIVAALALACALLLETRGVSGDVVPVLAWRWSARPAPPSAPATGADPPPAAAESAGDYPQFLGPARDGSVAAVRLARDWQVEPPRELWRRAVGAGWSAFAVRGPYAVTQEQRGADEVVACYERTTGRPLWTHADRTRHDDPMGGPGPRATPTIDGDRVYTLGGTGRLNALDLATGSLLWSVDVLADNDAQRPIYGVAGSPLVVDGQVVVVAGGRAERSLVAYDARSGARAWGAGDDAAAYGSPRGVHLGGMDQIVVLTQDHVVGHAVRDGARLWRFPWPQGTEKVAQPVALPGDRLFLSSGYGVGGKLLEVRASADGRFAVDLVWESPGLKAKFTNVVHRGGYLYGLDDGRLACVDAATGRRAWKGPRYGHGQVILVDDLLLVQAESGAVVLVEIGPDGSRELGRIPALHGKTWNHPALAGRHLLVRNDTEAACFELPLDEPGARLGRIRGNA